MTPTEEQQPVTLEQMEALQQMMAANMEAVSLCETKVLEMRNEVFTLLPVLIALAKGTAHCSAAAMEAAEISAIPELESTREALDTIDLRPSDAFLDEARALSNANPKRKATNLEEFGPGMRGHVSRLRRGVVDLSAHAEKLQRGMQHIKVERAIRPAKIAALGAPVGARTDTQGDPAA